MPIGFQPYENIQPQLERYDTIKSLQRFMSSSAVASKWQKNQVADYIEDKIKDIEKELKKKQRNQGIIGGILNVAAMFIPGMSVLGKSLLSGLIAGGTSLTSKKMIKKLKGRVEDLRSGLFTDKLVKDIETQYQGHIDNLDPVKAATTSFALSMLTGKIGEKTSDTKAPTVETAPYNQDVLPIKDPEVFTPSDIPQSGKGGAPWDFDTGVKDFDQGFSIEGDLPEGSTKPTYNASKFEYGKDLPSKYRQSYLLGNVRGFKDRKTFSDIFIQPLLDPTAKSSNVWQQFVSPFKAGGGDRVTSAAKNWTPFLSSYLSGATPAYGSNVEQLLNLLQQEGE